ncbi:MAG: tetratricopeptide repeat protein [Desulfosoma sp.]
MNRKRMRAAVIFLNVFLAFPAWGATVLQEVRIGLHPTHTRLVVQCTGDRPIAVSRLADRQWAISFGALESPETRKILPRTPRGKIQKLLLQKDGPEPQLRVFLKEDMTQAKVFTLEDEQHRQDGYRVVIDFGLPGVSALRFKEPEKLQAQSPAESKSEASSSSLASAASVPGDATASAQGAAPDPTTAPRSEGPSLEKSSKDKEPGVHAKRIVRPIEVGSPFDIADMTYEGLKGALPETAEQIVAAYQKAVQKDPQNPRRPLALLRSAEVLDKAGDVKKAERYYQRLIDEHPRDESTARAWIRLGEIHAARGNPLEALKAFQEADKFPLKPDDFIRSRLGTAQVYVRAGKASEALDILKRLTEAHPDAYLQQPEILRTIGEAAFALKDFAASRTSLIRYLNLAPDIPDKDIVLARIAESYLHEGNRAQADKLYAHIQVHYPDSEGDLIGRLRKAEYYESQGGELQEEAFKIYKDLESRPLAGPLKHFVQFKLAYGDYLAGQAELSLQRIDAALKSADKAPVYDDLRRLRQKVLHSLVKKRFEAGDAKGVIDLYGEDPFAFQEDDGLEALSCVAQAYESLGYCPDAMALYEFLAQKDPKDLWKLAVARTAYEMGQVDKAKSLCLAVTDGSLRDAKDELLARIAFSQKDYASVIRSVEGLAKQRGGPDHCPTDLAAMLALSYLETGKEDAAMPWAERCLDRSDWKDPSLLVALSLKASRVREKDRQYDQAVRLLDLGIAKVQSDDLRNQLTYQKAVLLLKEGRKDQAEKILAELLQSPKKLWKTAAKQKLDSLRLQPPTPQMMEKDGGAS